MSASTRERDLWVQACLQRLVAPSLTVDGALGPRSHQALREFQRRVREFVPDAPALTVDGQIGPATLAALARATAAPGDAAGARTAESPTSTVADEAPTLRTMAVAREAESLTRTVASEVPAPTLRTMAVAREAPAPTLRTMAVAREVESPTLTTADRYVERRVSVRVYGTVARTSALLVPVPGTCGAPKHLHVLAAQALVRMSAAAERDLGLALLLASAWRAHRWDSRAQYEAVLLAKYGSLAEGKRWLAFDSPHETGLAIDIGVGGLTPSRASVDAQRRSALHQWLVTRAWEFGWHPYKVEPWHWEYPLSLAAYRSGVLATDDPGPPIDALSFGLADDKDDLVLEDTDLAELPG